MHTGVAVLDTGIYRHRDFDKRITAFVDFVNGQKYPYDDNGHGTHVSGIIAGTGRASGGRYRGIDPQALIISVKVLDSNGNGKISDVIKGIMWIMKNKNKYNIKVVNISFGAVPGNNEEEKDKLIENVEKMWNMGIVVVAAAGNSGPEKDSVTVPGTSKKIITVGSYDDVNFSGKNKNKTKYYSGRGPTKECIIKPEIVVAGSGIVSCSNRKDSYSLKSGTSMSAPIVTGVISKYLETHPDYLPKDIKIELKKCCEKIDIPTNQQGWGVLNSVKFLKL